MNRWGGFILSLSLPLEWPTQRGNMRKGVVGIKRAVVYLAGGLFSLYAHVPHPLCFLLALRPFFSTWPREKKEGLSKEWKSPQGGRNVAGEGRALREGPGEFFVHLVDGRPQFSFKQVEFKGKLGIFLH